MNLWNEGISYLYQNTESICSAFFSCVIVGSFIILVVLQAYIIAMFMLYLNPLLSKAQKWQTFFLDIFKYCPNITPLCIIYMDE